MFFFFDFGSRDQFRWIRVEKRCLGRLCFLKTDVYLSENSSIYFRGKRPVEQTKMPVVARQDVCCGKTRSLLWQDKMCVVARQDLCCGKTRSLLWQDIRESTKGGGAAGAAPLCGGGRRPPPLCLATTEILSCHNRDLALPQRTSCLATTETLSCHNRDP